MHPPTDLRGLLPPEPLTRILAALEAEPGPHAFLLAHEPWPLYVILGSEWERQAVREADGSVLLTLTRREGVT